MGAVGMVARGEIRRRWRSVVVLTLLVGVVGAVVLATAAGARRSETALARFNTYSRSADLTLAVGDATPAQVRAFRGVHGVAVVGVLRAYAFEKPLANVLRNIPIAAETDGKFGTAIDRGRVIAGRAANPTAVDEITIGEGLAKQAHLGVGGHIDLAPYTLAQGEATGDPGPPAGPRLRLLIVGIVRRPLDLGDRGATGGVLLLPAAFDRTYVHRLAAYQLVLRVRTQRDDTKTAASVVAAARRIFVEPNSGGGPNVTPNSVAIERQGAQNAIDVLTIALWVFAAVAALAGIVAIGIVLTREISLAQSDQATLGALGLTRYQQVALSAPEALLVAGGGALIALLGAIAGSPLFPIGVARQADPNPGLHADWVVLGLGVIVIAAVVLTIALVAAVRMTSRSSPEIEPRGPRYRSTLVDVSASLGLSPTVTNGVRIAVQRGRGRTATPVRSAFVGAVFGVLGVTAVLVFSSSLSHLVATPSLSGWTWDFTAADITSQTSDGTPCGPTDYGVARLRGVAAVAAACYTQHIEIDGYPVFGWGFTPIRGTITPSVIAGRAPRDPREVALGSATLSAVNKSIGDTVRVRGPNGTRVYRIVGRIVLPKLAAPQPLADGAAFTGKGFSRVDPPGDNSNRFLLGRFAPDADRVRVEHRIATLSQLDPPHVATVAVEVDRLDHIAWFPGTLAGLLTFLALIAVGHALVTAVRRRRRDLALLKTFGFDRRQVRATVAWQATTLAAVGLMIGIPFGLIVGNLVWHRIADGLGVSTGATIPTGALLVVVPAVFLLVNLLAFFPARAAAQTRPSIALRAE